MLTRVNPCPEADPILYKIAGANPEQSVFFDIETTGFKPETSHLYLIGVSYPTLEGRKCIQWISEHPSEETAILRTFAAFLRPWPTLMHFNGEGFDLPYLEQKYKMYGIPSAFPGHSSLDLFRLLRPLKKPLSLSRMNQKSLEEFTGLMRKDSFNGGELINVYRKFIQNQDPGLLQQLLLHNLEDLTGMIRIMSMLSYLPVFHPGTCQVQEASAELPHTNPDHLEIRAQLPSPVPSGCTFVSELAKGSETETASLRASMTLEEDRLFLLVPLLQDELKYFFPDYKNYWYLPMENQAIHKSVAAFVDPAHRAKAAPQTCFTRKNGFFLPQYEELFSPVFRKDYKDRISYFEINEHLADQPEFACRYLYSLIPHMEIRRYSP